MKKNATRPSDVRRVDTGEIATQVVIRMLVGELAARDNSWDVGLTRKEWGLERTLTHGDYFFHMMTSGLPNSRLNQFSRTGGFLREHQGLYFVTEKLKSVCLTE